MSTPEVPAARRLRRRRWSDPKLLVGLVVAAACAVGAARFVQGADETVPVWAVRAEVRAGQAAEADQVRAVRVRLDETTLARYVRADGASGEEFVDALAGRTWSHDLAADELVPRAALAASDEAADAEVPVRVEPGAFPDDLAAGDRVGVFAAPADGPAVRVADDVRVVSVGAADAALGDTSARTVLLAVDETGLEELVAATGGARVTLVRVPGGRA